jgi:hypothetical protein
MVTFIQKGDLSADFINDNSNNAAGIGIDKSTLATTGTAVPTTAPAAGEPVDYYQTGVDPVRHYRWNGTTWLLVGDGRGLVNVVYLTTVGSGTYTVPDNINSIRIRMVGGGGGGAGCEAPASGQASAGAGGGGGGYREFLILNPTGAYIYSVGAGGAGGAGGVAGTAGGTTTMVGSGMFGAMLAIGGAGGNTLSPRSNTSIIPGAYGGNSDGPGFGFKGGHASLAGVDTGKVGAYSHGGDSVLGFGANAGGTGANGANANVYGAGGGGTGSFFPAGAIPGGAGSQGLIIIEEFQ